MESYAKPLPDPVLLDAMRHHTHTLMARVIADKGLFLSARSLDLAVRMFVSLQVTSEAAEALAPHFPFPLDDADAFITFYATSMVSNGNVPDDDFSFDAGDDA